jgi:hypothetical protein
MTKLNTRLALAVLALTVPLAAAVSQAAAPVTRPDMPSMTTVHRDANGRQGVADRHELELQRMEALTQERMDDQAHVAHSPATIAALQPQHD